MGRGGGRGATHEAGGTDWGEGGAHVTSDSHVETSFSCAMTSGLHGGVEQGTRLKTMPGSAVTWESGPATSSPDMEPGCLGAQAEGSNPQAPGCGGRRCGGGGFLTSLPFFVAGSSLSWGPSHYFRQ
ncbi:UNVERIFIED_CONTAM: hypothetical protein FKN15_074403 [Acipenser sinensis]